MEETYHNRIVNVMLTSNVPKDPNVKLPKKQKSKDSDTNPGKGRKSSKKKDIYIDPETGKEIEMVTKVLKSSSIKYQNIDRHLSDAHKKACKSANISERSGLWCIWLY